MKNVLSQELKTDYSIDQAILDQNFKIVVLKFSLNLNEAKFKSIFSIAKKNLKNIQMFTIDVKKVKEFDSMYEIKNEDSLIFYFSNRRISIDTNSGNNNKLSLQTLEFKRFEKLTSLIFNNCKKGKNFIQI
jgi:DIM1 family U5 snRNP protein